MPKAFLIKHKYKEDHQEPVGKLINPFTNPLIQINNF